MEERELPTTASPRRVRLDLLVSFLAVVAVCWVINAQFLNHPALQYTYLGRFPLIAAALLVGFPLIVAFVAPRLLGNLLTVTSPGQFFLSALSTFLAHVIASTSHIVLVFGPDRYGLEPAKEWLVNVWTSVGMRPGEFSPSAITLAMPLIVASAYASCREGIVGGRNPLVLMVELFLATLAGVATAFGVIWLAIPFRNVLATYLGPQIVAAGRFLGPGYTASDGGLADEHVHATAFLVVGILIYAVAWPLLRPDQQHPFCRWFRRHVPPLAYVLQILIVACWLLSGMSFYLDLYRVPPVLVIAAMSIFFHVISRADHYWDLIPVRTDGREESHRPIVADEPQALPPDAGLEAWLDRQEAGGVSQPTLVVLAVSGGGILSAAWSTLILGRLAARYPRFASSIRLASAVSGGAVGMAYWMEGWRNCAASPSPLPNLSTEEAAAIHERAATSSLEATSWGLAFPDLWRAVLPQFPRFDRGWAIEQAWEEALGTRPSTLRNWLDPVAEGRAPAFAFNSTIVESGERFQFSPIRTADRDPQAGNRFTRTFLRQFPHGDVSLFTAARLSAAFPYVGPNARARYLDDDHTLPPPRQYHFADGGFFDNFGMPTALEWIDTILERRAQLLEPDGPRPEDWVDRFEKWQKLSRVLLVQLRPFHVSRETPPPFHSAGISGWVNATFGPLRTLVNIWASTQTARGDAEFDLLRKHWTSRGVEIETAIFEYRGPGRLSWALTERDRRDLDAEAERYLSLSDDDARHAMAVMDHFVG